MSRDTILWSSCVETEISRGAGLRHFTASATQRGTRAIFLAKASVGNQKDGAFRNAGNLLRLRNLAA